MLKEENIECVNLFEAVLSEDNYFPNCRHLTEKDKSNNQSAENQNTHDQGAEDFSIDIKKTK